MRKHILPRIPILAALVAVAFFGLHAPAAGQQPAGINGQFQAAPFNGPWNPNIDPVLHPAFNPAMRFYNPYNPQWTPAWNPYLGNPYAFNPYVGNPYMYGNSLWTYPPIVSNYNWFGNAAFGPAPWNANLQGFPGQMAPFGRPNQFVPWQGRNNRGLPNVANQNRRQLQPFVPQPNNAQIIQGILKNNR